jgi:hypothetical protein|eukprot:COSAG01_NODE_2271_length_8025_cov_167.055135_4_plen_249_part_00
MWALWLAAAPGGGAGKMRLVSVADRSASDVEASSRRELDKLLKPENRPVALTLAPWPCALPPGCGVAVAVSVNGSSSPPPVDICVWCAHIRVTMPGLADVCTPPGAAPHPMRCCLPACLPACRALSADGATPAQLGSVGVRVRYTAGFVVDTSVNPTEVARAGPPRPAPPRPAQWCDDDDDHDDDDARRRRRREQFGGSSSSRRICETTLTFSVPVAGLSSVGAGSILHVHGTAQGIADGRCPPALPD